jgi:hypothetical protein
MYPIDEDPKYCLEYIETCLETFANIFSNKKINPVWNTVYKYFEKLIPNTEDIEADIRLRKLVYETADESIDSFLNDNPIINKHLYKEIEAKFNEFEMNSESTIKYLLQNKNFSINLAKEVLSDNLKENLIRITNKIKSLNKGPNPPFGSFSIYSTDRYLNIRLNEYLSKKDVIDTVYYITLRKIFFTVFVHIYADIKQVDITTDFGEINDSKTSKALDLLIMSSNILNDLNESPLSKNINWDELINNLNSLESKDFIKNFIDKKEPNSEFEPNIVNTFYKISTKTVIKEIHDVLFYVIEQLQLMLKNASEEKYVNYFKKFDINEKTIAVLNTYYDLFNSLMTD